MRVLSAALLSLDFTREHGAVVIGFAALLGVFFTRSALQGDRRFVVAGFPPGETVVACVAVLGVATAVVVVVSAIVTALDFTPDSWAPLLAAMVLLGLIYTGTGARSTSSAPPPWCCSW